MDERLFSRALRDGFSAALAMTPIADAGLSRGVPGLS
jgi:hypothetical protein